MPFLTSFSFELSNDPIIDLTTQGSVWNLSEGNTITWGISESNGFNDAAWVEPEYMVGRFEEAFAILQQYIDVEFQYAGLFANPQAAISAEADMVMFPDKYNPDDPYWAIAFFPDTNIENFPTAAGDAYFNIDAPFLQGTSWQMGSAGFMVHSARIGTRPWPEARP